jgi:hypothetical protein
LHILAQKQYQKQVISTCWATFRKPEVTALGADRFIVVENLGGSSRKISYFNISGEKIVLKDMVIVQDKLDNRISENVRNIYVKIDKLKEIQNK